MAMDPRDGYEDEAREPGPRRRLAPLPHRGAAVLTLGIVGVCLGALGLILVLTGTVRSPLGR